MPVVNRAFGFWLVPPGTATRRAQILGTVTVLLAYSVAVAIFMALK